MVRRLRPVAAGRVYRYERLKFKTNNLKRNRNNKSGASVEIRVLRKYTPGIIIRLITFKIRYNNFKIKSLKER